MPGVLDDLEKRLWGAADNMRANSGLGPSEYSTPVLGLIFLRFADVKFAHADEQLRADLPPNSRRTIGPTDYQALGVMYLPEPARYSRLMQLPESADIGSALNDAMRAIEAENPDLAGVLPTNFNRQGLTRDVLWSLLRLFAQIPLDTEGDVFGQIYEYFLGEFAKAEGSERRRVFHPGRHRPADRRDSRALPRTHPRSRLRLRRHVRAERPLCPEHKKTPTLNSRSMARRNAARRCASAR